MGKPPTLGRPATGLGRYYMDCGWYRHPKFAGLPIEALFLFEAGVGYCTEHNTNGVMAGDIEQLSLDLGIRLSAVRKGARTLLERGRWRRREDGTIEIVGYIDHNPMAEEVTEFVEVQRARSVYGNHVRHHVNKQVRKDDCPHCRDSLASVPSEVPAKEVASEGSLSDSHGLGWAENPPPTSSLPTDNAATNGAGEPSSPGEEETLTATWQRLARHDLQQHLATGGIVRSTDGFLRKAADTRRSNLEDRALHELELQPNLDHVTLAEVLDPACGPDDAGRARAHAAAAATDARLAEQRALADWHQQADEAIGALDEDGRAQLEERARQQLADEGITDPWRAILTARQRRIVMLTPPPGDDDQASNVRPAKARSEAGW